MIPYIIENITRMKVVLPVKREKVWSLVGVAEGFSAWFPKSCQGKIAKGEILEFGWMSGSPDRFRVLEVVENQWWEMEWSDGATIRFSLDDENPVIFTLEVTYPKSPQGETAQMQEVTGWIFYLVNLKSILLNGPDLRNNNPSYSWRERFIDS